MKRLLCERLASFVRLKPSLSQQQQQQMSKTTANEEKILMEHIAAENQGDKRRSITEASNPASDAAVVAKTDGTSAADTDTAADDWMLAARVIDRLCFMAFTICIVIGTIAIFFFGGC